MPSCCSGIMIHEVNPSPAIHSPFPTVKKFNKYKGMNINEMHIDSNPDGNGVGFSQVVDLVLWST